MATTAHEWAGADCSPFTGSAIELNETNNNNKEDKRFTRESSGKPCVEDALRYVNLS